MYTTKGTVHLPIGTYFWPPPINIKLTTMLLYFIVGRGPKHMSNTFILFFMSFWLCVAAITCTILFYCVACTKYNVWSYLRLFLIRRTYLLRRHKKAPAGFEPTISCLLDRRFNQLSHGAILQTSGKVREKKIRTQQLKTGLLLCYSFDHRDCCWMGVQFISSSLWFWRRLKLARNYLAQTISWIVF